MASWITARRKGRSAAARDADVEQLPDLGIFAICYDDDLEILLEWNSGYVHVETLRIVTLQYSGTIVRERGELLSASRHFKPEP